MSNPKIDVDPIIRFLRDEVAIAIHIPDTRCNPLVASTISIDYCPDIFGSKLPNNFKIRSESLKTNAVPNVVETCSGMAIRFEKLKKRRLRERRRVLPACDLPVWRQTLVPSSNP